MNPAQQKILRILQLRKRITSAEVSIILNVTVNTAGRSLRSMAEMGYIHVVAQDDSNPRMPSNIYVIGAKDYVAPVKKRKERDRSETNQVLSDAALQYLAKNNARFVSQDFRMNHAEHVRFMTKFQSHPDPASEWLFNEPKVELEGNKYDLVQA